ncbi:MAG: PAS domain-containing protein, partial [Bacteroidetes bacterium]|nr:PAS domain-containing protein [Bacteroidota bacterium]
MRNRKNSINTQFLYESVVNSMDDGVISKTLDGFITTFNPAAETLFGYTADEVIGKHISIIIPADKLSEENDIISKIKDGHYIGNFLTERVGKDGTVISVSLTLSPIKNTTGKLIGVFTIAKNITDKIAAEKKLEQITQEVSYYKFALIESSIISITDTKGAIIFANDNFSKISKYSVNELIGQDLRIINSGYHPKEYIHSLWTTIAKGNIWRGEFKNKAKDGSFYWVNTTIVPFLDGQGEPYQYVAINEDINERKRAELTIEFEKNNLKALINNTYDLMWSVDRSFNLITSNKGFDDMVKKIIGKSVSPGAGRNLKATNNKLLKRFKAYYE